MYRLNVRYKVNRIAPGRWRVAREVPALTGGERTISYTVLYAPDGLTAIGHAVRYADEAR